MLDIRTNLYIRLAHFQVRKIWQALCNISVQTLLICIYSNFLCKLESQSSLYIYEGRGRNKEININKGQHGCYLKIHIPYLIYACKHTPILTNAHAKRSDSKRRRKKTANRYTRDIFGHQRGDRVHYIMALFKLLRLINNFMNLLTLERVIHLFPKLPLSWWPWSALLLPIKCIAKCLCPKS